MQNLKNITHNTLSNEWATLHRIDYDYQFKNGAWKRLSRETYNRGHGTAVLLYNIEKRTIILTKQFRMPIHETNPNESQSIEACAGAIDQNDSPQSTIIREIEEEVGYRVEHVEHVLSAYSSPGALTEKMYLFVAQYNDRMKVNEGGGLDNEDEDIEVLEMPFSQAIHMMNNHEIIDAKTIMLLQYAQIHNLVE